jgi:hypothetical protein
MRAMRALIIALTGLGLGLAAPATSVLSGRLATNSGPPLRAALTLHDVSTARTQGQQPFDHQFASKVDGTFSIAGVPPGTYQICVEAPQANVLDPCVWSQTPPTVTVPATGNVSGLNIIVDTGYLMKVHINDPLTVLPSPKGGIAGAALSVRVITRANRHVNFRLLGAAATGWDHYLLVPFGEPLTLAIDSSTLSLANASNVPLGGNSLRMPVWIPKGGSVQPVTVNVGTAAGISTSPH